MTGLTQSPMPALGERFRAAREARGLELSEVAEQIHVRSVHLAAIEEENWREIGVPVYVRGFLRTYARFLGIDGEEAVAEFGALDAAEVEPVAESAPRTRGDRGRLSPLLYVASAVAIVLIAFVVYNYFTLGRQNGVASVPSPPAASGALPSNTTLPGGVGASPQTNASPLASPNASGSPSTVPIALSTGPTPNTLELVFSGQSWLRVTIDGSVSMEGTFPAGTVKVFHGKTAVVRIGNAGAVDVYADGQPVGKLGGLGEVADRSFKL